MAHTLLLIALLIALPLPGGVQAALPSSAANPPAPDGPYGQPTPASGMTG